MERLKLKAMRHGGFLLWLSAGVQLMKFCGTVCVNIQSVAYFSTVRKRFLKALTHLARLRGIKIFFCPW